jgi:hypothetical protein
MIHMATLDLREHPAGFEPYLSPDATPIESPSLCVFHKGHQITIETEGVDIYSYTDLVRMVTVDRFREAHGELEAQYGQQKYGDTGEGGAKKAVPQGFSVRQGDL